MIVLRNARDEGDLQFFLIFAAAFLTDAYKKGQDRNDAEEGRIECTISA